MAEGQDEKLQLKDNGMNQATPKQNLEDLQVETR